MPTMNQRRSGAWMCDSCGARNQFEDGPVCEDCGADNSLTPADRALIDNLPHDWADPEDKW